MTSIVDTISNFDNVISQPSHEIPLLRHLLLKEAKRGIIRERKPRGEERMNKEHTGNRGKREMDKGGTTRRQGDGEGKKSCT
jgi:hypothetical protein